MQSMSDHKYQYFLKRCSSFDLKGFLVDNGIEFEENGSQLIFEKCPKCGRSKKFYVNQDTKQFQCFRKSCRFGIGQNLAHLVAYIDNTTYWQAFYKIVGKRKKLPVVLSGELKDPYSSKDKKIKLETLPEIILPYNFYDFERSHRANREGFLYLESRGINKDLARKFDLRYCPEMKRVIFPVKMYDKIVGYQGRDITNRWKADSKYPKALTSKGFQKSKALFNYDNVRDKKLVTIVEGPVDAIKAHRINAVAQFGSILSEYQLRLIREIPNLETVIVALDSDAIEAIDETAKILAPFYDIFVIRFPDGRDPGDFSPEEIVNFAKSACTYNYYKL